MNNYDISPKETETDEEIINRIRIKSESDKANSIDEIRKVREEQDKEYQHILSELQDSDENEHTTAKILPPEPEDGIIVMVNLPNGKRLSRKFGFDTTGEDLRYFLSIELDIKKDFAVKHTTGETIQNDLKLVDQQFHKRTLVSVFY